MKSIVNHRRKQALYESCVADKVHDTGSEKELAKIAIRHSCRITVTN